MGTFSGKGHRRGADPVCYSQVKDIEEWGGKVAPTEVAFPIVSHKMQQLLYNLVQGAEDEIAI